MGRQSSTVKGPEVTGSPAKASSPRSSTSSLDTMAALNTSKLVSMGAERCSSAISTVSSSTARASSSAEKGAG